VPSTDDLRAAHWTRRFILAGTGRIVRLSMYGITEREVLEVREVEPAARPSFLVRLADAGDARSRGEDVDARPDPTDAGVELPR
jgi:hypothetical protein